MKIRMVAIILCSLILMACQGKKDIPEPEVSTVMKQLGMPQEGLQNEAAFLVQHHLDGNNLFIECYVKGVTFRDDSSLKDRGKIIVYINGKKQTEVQSAAFILKGLPSGKHHIRLEIVSLENKQFHLEKQFSVTVP